MKNAISLERETTISAVGTAEACPFFDTGDICGAAISACVIGWKRKLVFCTTDDHDDCPLFISKVLREGSFRNPRA
jgi:hypothetical protein